MKIIKVSQENDRESWLDFRRGKITGTKYKGLKPLSRGADRTPQGFWELLAEKVSIQPDGENVMDRGLRLQSEAIELTAKMCKLNIVTDAGMWVSDVSDDIAVSPDAYEDCDSPSYAIEAKCLNTANHLKYVISDIRAKKTNNYSAFAQIPSDNKEQIIQYFVVNDDLLTLYFTLYDDRISSDFYKYAHHIIKIDRCEVEGDIQLAKEIQMKVLLDIEDTIEEMKNGKD